MVRSTHTVSGSMTGMLGYGSEPGLTGLPCSSESGQLACMSAVPMSCLRDIFAKLKHAEVILTFYIDSLISYLNEKNLADFELSTGMRSSVRAADLDEIKQSPRWPRLAGTRGHRRRRAGGPVSPGCR